MVNAALYALRVCASGFYQRDVDRMSLIYELCQFSALICFSLTNHFISHSIMVIRRKVITQEQFDRIRDHHIAMMLTDDRQDSFIRLYVPGREDDFPHPAIQWTEGFSKAAEASVDRAFAQDNTQVLQLAQLLVERYMVAIFLDQQLSGHCGAEHAFVERQERQRSYYNCFFTFPRQFHPVFKHI